MRNIWSKTWGMVRAESVEITEGVVKARGVTKDGKPFGVYEVFPLSDVSRISRVDGVKA